MTNWRDVVNGSSNTKITDYFYKTVEVVIRQVATSIECLCFPASPNEITKQSNIRVPHSGKGYNIIIDEQQNTNQSGPRDPKKYNKPRSISFPASLSFVQLFINTPL